MSWPVVKIADVATTQYGYTASAVDEPVGPKFLRITDIVPPSIDWDSVPHCKIEQNNYQKYKLTSGDIVVARTGATTGYAKLIRSESDAIFASYLVRFRVSDNMVDDRFLGIVMESDSYKAFIKSSMGGAAQPNANAKTLARYPLPLPPRNVQVRIADILSTYDDLIENNRRRIALLEEAARLLYREWFIHFRFPGHEHVKITDGLPEGWELLAVSSAMEVLSGGTPKTNNPLFWNGNISFFTPKDATDTPYVQDTQKSITEQGLRACNSELYPAETLFITARGTVGKLNLALHPMAMNQSCYALRSTTHLGQRHAFLALGASIQQLKARATGAVFDAVIVATFDQIPLLIPSKNVSKPFSLHIEPIFDQIANLIQQNNRLAHARDLLLPRLLSGEIAV